MPRLASRAYSQRLGTLTHEQLQAACDRFDVGELLEAEPAETGLFGQNVLLTTRTGRWVLRGSPHTPWQLDHEAWFARELDLHTDVPAPWPYHVENDTDVFGWPYGLMRRLDGEPPQALWKDASPAQRLAIAAAMGDALARLQALEGPGYGTRDPETGAIDAHADFEAWTLSRIREQVDEARGIDGALDDEDEALIDQCIDAQRGGLEVAAEPRFLHADYAPGNVTVQERDGWVVSGVFDLQMAGFGDGEEDLVRLVGIFARNAPECVRPFVAAYTEARPLRPGHRERFQLHTLRDRLILWNYGRANGVWFEADTRFRDFVAFFLAQDPFGDGDAA